MPLHLSWRRLTVIFLFGSLIVAVGLGGTVLGHSETRWEPIGSGTDGAALDVWGFENYQAVAVDEGGTVLQSDGPTSTPMMSATEFGDGPFTGPRE